MKSASDGLGNGHAHFAACGNEVTRTGELRRNEGGDFVDVYKMFPPPR